MLHKPAKMIWGKDFGIPSMLGGWWFGVGEPDDHPFFQSIHSAKYPSFSSSFSSNHTGTKWLVGHPVEFNQFHTPTRGDDLCLSFCLILNLWLLYTQLQYIKCDKLKLGSLVHCTTVYHGEIHLRICPPADQSEPSMCHTYSYKLYCNWRES